MIRLLFVLLTMAGTAIAGTEASPVVKITNRANGNTGSGVIFQDNGAEALVITCGHIFRGGAGEVIVCTDNKCFIGRAVKVDQTRELSVVKIASPRVGVRQIAPGRPAVNQPVEVCGYAGDQIGSLKTHVRAYNNGNRWVEFVGKVPEGYSGGPVFNARCEVAGIVWGQSYAVHADDIRDFIRGIPGVRTGTPSIFPGPGAEPYRTQPVDPADVPPSLSPGWTPPKLDLSRPPPVDFERKPLVIDAEFDANAPLVDVAATAAPPSSTPVPHDDNQPGTGQSPRSVSSGVDWRGVLRTATPYAVNGLAIALGVGVTGGTGYAGWKLAAMAGKALIRRRRRRREDRRPPPAPVRLRPYKPTPATAHDRDVVDAPGDEEKPPPSGFHLGWRDEDGPPPSTNRYVRVEKPDLSGEGYRRAIAQFAQANPESAGYLESVEEAAKLHTHGLRVKAGMEPAADDPVIYPSEKGS